MSSPLTSPDCNLQDFAFMPLDVARLRDSDLAANETPEACWAAVQLWAASWHQIPAASIPNCDKWMAKATGYGRGVKDWLKVREGALRGFVMCTDDRLYHTVVAEKAREAWRAKIEQRYRTEVARVKKHNQRHETKFTVPEFDDWLSLGRPSGHHLSVPGDNAKLPKDNTGDKPSKGQGEGQRQGDSITLPIGKGSAAAAGKRAKTVEELRKSELWRSIKTLLVDTEEAKDLKAAGAVITKVITRYDEPTALAAIEATLHARPAGVIAYLEAACQNATGNRLNKQESLEASNFAAAERFAEA